MTTFTGACVTEQGVTFGIIVVLPQVLGNLPQEAMVRAFGQRVFGAIPIVLMDAHTRPARFSGRLDLVQLLTQIPVTAIPLVEWSVPDA